MKLTWRVRQGFFLSMITLRIYALCIGKDLCVCVDKCCLKCVNSGIHFLPRVHWICTCSEFVVLYVNYVQACWQQRLGKEEVPRDYPIKSSHGFIMGCFVLITLTFLTCLHHSFTHILLVCFKIQQIVWWRPCTVKYRIYLIAYNS